jgi:uncharacterized protein (TIGR03437 family)
MHTFALTNLLFTAVLLAVTAEAQPTCANSVTGSAVPAMAGLDQTIQGAISKYNVAGGSLAVSYNGRLVFARGYGCADKASNTAVQPDSLFRVASVSKTFTAVGIMELVQQGKLSLDTLVFVSILTDYTPLPGKVINPDLLKITVRHLLQHTGGWDRSTNQTFNGVVYHEPADDLLAAAAQATEHAAPATDADLVRVMLSQPLQHTPGTFYAYYDFGYILLARVIEHVSGLTYEQYVQQNILKALGIGRQKLGASLQSDTVNGEVTYYDIPGTAPVPSFFPDITTPVPAQYGGQKFFEDTEASGGWVANTVDLARYLDGIGVSGGATALLNAQTIASMQVDPQIPNEKGGSYYGLGFNYSPVNGGLKWGKTGGITGTLAHVVVNPVSGFTWAVAFNGNATPVTGGAEDTGGGFFAEVLSGIESALQEVNNKNAVPTSNLYPNFKSTLLPPTFSTVEPPVTNGATYQPGIVSGSWVQIKGQNLATATRIWWADEILGAILPVEIDRVRVTINGKNAAVYYVSPTQINVQAPTDNTLGPVNVQVTRDGTVSGVFQASYIASAPGYFTYSANGRNFPASVHLNGAYVGDVAGTTPAKPGETILLFATGLGETPGGTAPPVTFLTPPPVVTIGGVAASVVAALIYPGEWQLNVVVPQVPAGEPPITLSYGGAAALMPTYLAIGSN